MIDPELLALLVCPETHQELAEAGPVDVARINEAIGQGRVANAGGQAVSEAVEGALIRADGRIAYPVRDDIPVMLVAEGLVVGELGLGAKVSFHG